MIRRFLGMLLVAVFALAVVGCGSSSSDAEDDECAENPSAPICQGIDEDATQIVE